MLAIFNSEDVNTVVIPTQKLKLHRLQSASKTKKTPTSQRPEKQLGVAIKKTKMYPKIMLIHKDMRNGLVASDHEHGVDPKWVFHYIHHFAGYILVS